ncbi:MAG: ABC transporter permease, partial [Desulfobacterales bacterium]|nr:ABC transporter permease [Desulfobacterales bacterium]
TGLDRILARGRWFQEHERRALLVSERTAESLAIDLQRHDEVDITLWGIPFKVVGVFSGKKLKEFSDLDGEPLTPAIFPGEMSTGITEVEKEALESGEDIQTFQTRYQHVPEELTIIMPHETLLSLGGHLKSIAVRPKAGNQARTAAYLADRFGLTLFSGEAEGTYLYHASDTLSYSGMPNIIIPLIISVFIVLNTMIGSVYERKREIAVYTSVGLAPSHVSFLFIAEALSFAVLSVVLGYILAQTSTRLFAGTSLWAGITVNYSSLAGVAAMFLVILVVLISVIYPARVAAEIAIPDVNRSWKLPAVVGNQLEVTLPFLMKYQEHKGIGGCIFEYFKGHQDVSHGLFSTEDVRFAFVCPVPSDRLSTEGACTDGACCFDACLQLQAKVWLSPFDFGIRQAMEVQFCPAPDESGFLEIRVRLVRESGEANVWRRINKVFLHEFRKQLLVWRSLDAASQQQYAQLLNTGQADPT